MLHAEAEASDHQAAQLSTSASSPGSGAGLLPYSPSAEALSAEARAGLLEDASDAGLSAYGPDAVLHAFPHTGAGPLPNSPMSQLLPADLGAGPVNYASRAGLCGHGADTMLPCPMGPPEDVHMTASLCMPPTTHEATFHQHPDIYSNLTSFEASPMAIQSFPYYSDMVCQMPNADSISNPAWSHAAEHRVRCCPFQLWKLNVGTQCFTRSVQISLHQS